MTNSKRQNVSSVRRTVFLLTMIVLCAGCSSLWKAREKIVIERDTTIVHHRDTMFRKDSVYIREWMKGDTVFVDRFRDRYVYRDRWRDSVRIVERHDTTSVEVKVEKNLSWGQKAKIGAFPWLLLTLAGALLWIFRKFIFK